MKEMSDYELFYLYVFGECNLDTDQIASMLEAKGYKPNDVFEQLVDVFQEIDLGNGLKISDLKGGGSV